MPYRYDRRTASDSLIFHNVHEIERAYPWAAGWQFSGPVGRFFKKHPGVRIQVKTIALERWTAAVLGDGWSVEGPQATSEAHAIRLAIRETLSRAPSG